MKVAIFGGTGYVGSYIIDSIISDGMIPRVMVREGSDAKVIQPNKCEIIYGNIEDENSINETLKGCDSAIFLIALIREFPSENITNERFQFEGSKRVMRLAEKNGIKRFILMSALGANPNPNGSKYMQAKYLSEQSIKNTNLDWTIIRPSSLFGNPRGNDRPEFCMMLDKLMLSLLPYPKFLPFPAPSFFKGISPFDAGNYSLSMVHVKDVASIILNVLKDDKAIGETLEVGGKDEVSWNKIIKTIAEVTKRRVIMVPAPIFLISFIAGLLDRFKWFPAGKDQLDDLVNGSVCDSSELFKRYGIEPIIFNNENLNYLSD